ncbi:transglutaminase family protein [uncultured Roseobacter sp.]|uniref:transglutaminase family protein n=1 Tax=uncultured Roseobacter sp. TaxID=114847 RepID=UPI0026374156|nr:transglutaminase family protein [uncultured Roseobacter sp.]
MLLSIRHETRYSYSHPVEYALQKVRLTPRSDAVQTVVEWTLHADGGKAEAGYRDHYGNQTDLISANPGTTELIIRAEGQINTKDTAGVFGQVYGRAPLWHFQRETPQTTCNPAIRDLAAGMAEAGDRLTELHALSASVLEAVPYETGATQVGTTAAEALATGKGVCQDHAHIFIAAARSAGIPARYVSGYLMMDDRADQDASHAWAEAHIDRLGWVGFDVSNGISPDERYVRIAIGRDGAEAAPIYGLRHGTADESMIVSLQVQQ